MNRNRGGSHLFTITVLSFAICMCTQFVFVFMHLSGLQFLPKNFKNQKFLHNATKLILNQYPIRTNSSTWVTSEAYSSPSIVLSGRSGSGGRFIFDDFREAYYWLRKNTPDDAKIMSWLESLLILGIFCLIIMNL